MMSMNKKGVAISIIIYAIIFLVIAILDIILLIEKNKYNVNGELRENIIKELNENINE